MISMPFHANLVSPCSVLVLITFAVSTGLPTQLVSAWTFHQCKDSQFNTGLYDIECASMISMPFHANLVSSRSVLVLITFAVSTGLPTQLVSAWTFHQCKDSQSKGTGVRLDLLHICICEYVVSCSLCRTS